MMHAICRFGIILGFFSVFYVQNNIKNQFMLDVHLFNLTNTFKQTEGIVHVMLTNNSTKKIIKFLKNTKDV